jgi:hypothetical protein
MAEGLAAMDEIQIPPGEEAGNSKGKKSKQGPRKRVSQACDRYVDGGHVCFPFCVLLAH